MSVLSLGGTWAGLAAGPRFASADPCEVPFLQTVVANYVLALTVFCCVLSTTAIAGHSAMLSGRVLRTREGVNRVRWVLLMQMLGVFLSCLRRLGQVIGFLKGQIWLCQQASLYVCAHPGCRKRVDHEACDRAFHRNRNARRVFVGRRWNQQSFPLLSECVSESENVAR